MKLTDKILKRTEKALVRSNYKTTSFTLLKDDYHRFKDICFNKGITASLFLREFVLLIIEENGEIKK